MISTSGATSCRILVGVAHHVARTLLVKLQLLAVQCQVAAPEQVLQQVQGLYEALQLAAAAASSAGRGRACFAVLLFAK
jgi:hypothetical protein